MPATFGMGNAVIAGMARSYPLGDVGARPQVAFCRITVATKVPPSHSSLLTPHSSLLMGTFFIPSYLITIIKKLQGR
jgi:hypothetical protein